MSKLTSLAVRPVRYSWYHLSEGVFFWRKLFGAFFSAPVFLREFRACRFWRKFFETIFFAPKILFQNADKKLPDK